MGWKRVLVKTWRAVALLVVWAFSGQGVHSVHSSEPLPEVVLRIGMHQVTAEVAASQKAREQGLMFRPVLPAHRGMLFLFPVADRHCMWMRNTVIPLAVAFLADDGRIVQIDEMAPNTLTPHCAKQPVRWALEMAGGWFRERGIVVGMRVAGLPAE